MLCLRTAVYALSTFLGQCYHLCVLLKMEIFRGPPPPIVLAFTIPRHQGLSVQGQPWLYRETVSEKFS